MDYIDKALDRLGEWIDKVMDALFGPQAQPEQEPIPIPVDERSRSGR